MAIDPIETLAQRFDSALVAILGNEFSGTDPVIRSTQNPKFGDFQCNIAMGLAKRIGQNPRELASSILESLDVSDLCDPPELAGPGFINLRLKPHALNDMLVSMDDASLGIVPVDGTTSHRVIVDLVGVNIAKSMHVGHLRSSIIGDSLARVFARVGYDALPQNHLGDWGLQIAMVLTKLRERKVDLSTLTVGALEAAYREANLEGKADRRALETAKRLNSGPHRIAAWEEQVAGAEEATAAAKATLVALQNGDPDLVRDWETITSITLQACYEIYDLLDLTVTDEHNRGESFYRDRLKQVVDEFVEAGIAEEDDGAILIRLEGIEAPLIIRKSDGGFLYATTDLAALRYRLKDLGAERVIYVVDARQRDHFRMLFAAVNKIGWDQLPDGRTVDLIHVPFGSVCGDDGKPLKTRSGDNVKLKDLLLEAIRRAGEIVREKNPDLSADEQTDVARAVGIGSVKYADLSTQINKDYVFSWDRMLAFEGNTGAYLQNQYVRIRAIQRKLDDLDTNPDAAFSVDAPEEKQLALALLRYPTLVALVADSLEPSRMCQYLYDLAGAFSTFYTNCSVRGADTPEQRDGRLRLCRLTEKVLADGFSLLGIRTLERM